MTHIDSTSSLRAPAPPRGRALRRLTHGLVPLIVPALVVAALGCRQDAESPTAPELGPALKTTLAQACRSVR